MTTKLIIPLLILSVTLITAILTSASNEARAMSEVPSITPGLKATATATGSFASAMTGTTITTKEDTKRMGDKCNNVMILVKVKDIPDTLVTLVVTANLDGRNIVKALNIKDQTIVDLAGSTKDGSLTVPLSFKKLDGCKSGDEFAGSVNDVAFTGKLDTPRKPTKVSVSLLSSTSFPTTR